MNSTMILILSAMAVAGIISVLYIIAKNRKVSKNHVFFTDMLLGETEDTTSEVDMPEPTADMKAKMVQEDEDSKEFYEYK